MSNHLTLLIIHALLNLFFSCRKRFASIPFHDMVQIFIKLANDLLPPSMSKELLAGHSAEEAKKADVMVFLLIYTRLLLIYASNNFPGWSEPESFWPDAFLAISRSSSNRSLFLALCRVPGSSAKAIIRKFLQVAIETDDTQLIGLMFGWNLTSINVNAEIIVFGKKKLTLIEYSARLNAVSTTEVLCTRLADVNKTYTNRPMNGALNGAIFHLREIGIDLIRPLFEAGAKIHPKAISHLISQQQAKAVEYLMRAKAVQYHKEWSTEGIFHDAIRHLDSKTSLKVIDIMLAVGADINFHLQSSNRNSPQQEPQLATILDVASYQGDFDLAKRLLSSHALPTQDTLSCAIRGGSAKLVDHLLERGTGVDDITTFGSSPFAEAVRAEDDGLAQRLIGVGALSRLKKKDYFRAAMEAASEVGNINLICDMLDFRAEIGAKNLAISGLTTAVMVDQMDVALLLIEAGAEINDKFLGLALDRCSLPIARAILEAGVTFS